MTGLFAVLPPLHWAQGVKQTFLSTAHGWDTLREPEPHLLHSFTFPSAPSPSPALLGPGVKHSSQHTLGAGSVLQTQMKANQFPISSPRDYL